MQYVVSQMLCFFTKDQLLEFFFDNLFDSLSIWLKFKNMNYRNVLFMFFLLLSKKRCDETLSLETLMSLWNCLNRLIDDQKIIITKRMNENSTKMRRELKKQRKWCWRITMKFQRVSIVFSQAKSSWFCFSCSFWTMCILHCN
jgi:hypothetical protein